jgi:ParB-like chromosome segregation protein Spo0J
LPEAHPPFQELPPLSRHDYDRLKASVAEHGFLEPIEVDEDGNTLDGHHRLRIAAELGIDPPAQRVIPGMTEEQKRDYALTVNLARRQMSVGEKRELWRRRDEEIAERLRANPAASNRQIAEVVGVDHKTVAKARAEAEQTGDVPSFRAKGGRGKREGEQVAEDEPENDRRDVANHRAHSSFELTLYYPAPSEQERTRGGLPYTRESETHVWFSKELVITAPPPRHRAEVRAYTEAIRFRIEQAMLADPLLTMGDDDEPAAGLQQLSPVASVFLG